MVNKEPGYVYILTNPGIDATWLRNSYRKDFENQFRVQ